MGRVTRKKAAEIADQLHVDEDAVLDMSSDDTAPLKAKATTPDHSDRAPLGELAPNSADSNNNHSEDGVQELKKSTRSRKGAKKGAAKSKKNNLAASTASQAAEEPHDEVLPDDNDSVPSPASEKAAEDLIKGIPECEYRANSMSSSRSHDANAGVSAVSISHAVEDTRPRSPPSAAVKLTRSQLKEKKSMIVDSEPKVLVDGLDQEQTMKEETVRNIPVINSGESDLVNGNSEATVLDAPASPLPSAMPNVVSNLRVDLPAKRSTSNKENVEPADDMESPVPAYDELEHAAVSAGTPPREERSELESSVRPEDHIAALDELDEAVESISRDIPEVPTSPQKPKTKKEKAAPVVRTTKAAAARISLAHGSKDTARAPALGRPSPQKDLGRSNSSRVASGSSNRVVSGSSAKNGSPLANGEKKDVVIPHSKPRPISMSFPTPPPPPKSTKAPTQSSFKLPGEAVAEKLKAAKEARMAREAEEEKKKAFKARPVPASLSKAPSVRQTNSSKARESLMNGKPVSTASKPPAHQRANSVATTRPTAPKPRVVSTDRSTSKPTSSSTSSRPPLYAPTKRPSTAMAEMSKPRASLATSNGPSGPARIPSGQSKGTAKGKEVFNRAAAAKAAADKEKQEKEDATKRARAEAAERSKQAARAFAEKQKKKQLAAKQAAQKTEEQSAETPGDAAGPTAVEA